MLGVAEEKLSVLENKKLRRQMCAAERIEGGHRIRAAQELDEGETAVPCAIALVRHAYRDDVPVRAAERAELPLVGLEREVADAEPRGELLLADAFATCGKFSWSTFFTQSTAWRTAIAGYHEVKIRSRVMLK